VAGAWLVGRVGLEPTTSLMCGPGPDEVSVEPPDPRGLAARPERWHVSGGAFEMLEQWAWSAWLSDGLTQSD